MTLEKPVLKLQRNVAYVVSAVLLFSFFLGFFLSEGKTSPAHGDFFYFHLPAIRTFQKVPFLDALRSYQSATTPLFHVLSAYGPLRVESVWYYLASTVISAGMTGVFFWLLIRRFGWENAPVASLFASVILLSPYYRSQAYWPSTDNTATWLLILTFVALDIAERRAGKRALFFILAAAILSAAAFYTRQTYAWLMCYVVVQAARSSVRKIWLLVFPVLLAPGAYMFWLWKGLTPPLFRQHHEGISIGGIAFICFSILFCACPFLIAQLSRNGVRLEKHTVIGVVCGVIVAGLAMTMAHNPFVDENSLIKISGVWVKAIQMTGKAGAPLYYLFVAAGVAVVTVLFQCVNWQSRILMALVIGSCIVVRVSFQRYYDPTLLIVFLGAIDRDFIRRVFTVRAAVLVLIFEGLIWSASTFK